MARHRVFARCMRRLSGKSGIEHLERRGLWRAQLPDPLPDTLRSLVAQGGVSAYTGIDPTASSLHLGHLLPLCSLLHLNKLGINTIVVLGGATARVGDPSGKTDDRVSLPPHALTENLEKIREQIRRLYQNFVKYKCDERPPASFTVLDNSEWYGSRDVISLLAEESRHMRVGHMLSLKLVKSRLETSGLSLAEFFYQFLQAYDFYHLFRTHNCAIQVGGSDQWGNMLGGYEYIKRRCEDPQIAFFSCPLLTRGGVKMGKSSGSAPVSLHPQTASPYTLYQYLLNLPDDEIRQLLVSLTFEEESEVERVLASGEPWAGQRMLARSVVTLVHGQEGVDRAEKLTQVLYSNQSILHLHGDLMKDLLISLPVLKVSPSESVVNVCSKANYFPKEAQKHQAIAAGALTVDGTKLTDPEASVGDRCPTDSQYSILSIGKRFKAIIQWV